jgi:hypothetical protein
MKNAVRKPAAKTRKSNSKKSAKVQAKAAKTKPAANSKPARERDPRLPAAGTVLTREHDGKVHEITVLDRGFKYQGKEFKSLSKVAQAITGTIWNGYLWLGLIKRPTKLVAAATSSARSSSAPSSSAEEG